MKVAVITRHAISNYGSLLQAIATQEAIERLGHSCEIIDYVRSDESYLQQEITLLKTKPNWYNNPIKRGIYLAVRQPESIIAGKKFEKERKEYLKMSPSFNTLSQLMKHPPEADVYMTGSDQVWGPVANGTYDPSYCLCFTKGKKIAYAASFGQERLDEKRQLYYKKWLGKYQHIAVREDSAVELLGEMGISANQVLDPTLLLNEKYWEQYFIPIKEKKYVLVYQLHNDNELGEYAKKVARKKRLPLIRISASLHQISREGKFRHNPQIGKFLSYIKNADCMITDSFHGTAFALNFNTPFIEVLPNNKTGGRNLSILKLTGLSNQILKDTRDVSLAMIPIDFTNANKILRRKREESLHILKTMIED